MKIEQTLIQKEVQITKMYFRRSLFPGRPFLQSDQIGSYMKTHKNKRILSDPLSILKSEIREKFVFNRIL